jgi:D-tyrosyl-tRNA(Tyr) deacylase
MRAVIQRVSSASVTIDDRVTGAIEGGLLVLLGIATGDAPADGAWLAQKIAGLRIFPDPEGRMNRSVAEIGGSVLVVSQFTLHASTRKGTRPSFNDAARPEVAQPLYELFLDQIAAELRPPTPLAAAGRIAAGEFGALMRVALVNDGPVTIVIDSRLRE